MIGILGWIVFGLVVGALAKLLMPGKDPGGIVVTMVLGIAGALMGGFLGRMFGWYAAGEPAGAMQDAPEWSERLFACHREAVGVGASEGASLDDEALAALLATPLGGMRTSMQKDFEARRPLELDAIGGPIVRQGRRHGLATAATEELIRLVEQRLAQAG